MRRDIRGTIEYWDEWIKFSNESISKRWSQIELPSGNPGYRPQYVYDLAKKNLYLMIQMYSRGDKVDEIVCGFPGLLDAWEYSNSLALEVWSEQSRHVRNAWSINLHRYMDCFWLVGLALALDLPDGQWRRLLALMGNEGEDVLLDRVIATRQPERRIGTGLCFPKAYQKLLQVVDAPDQERPQRLRDYLDGWYAGLKNAGKSDIDPFLKTPYWYTYGDDNFEGGAYFGRWCIEAVAVAKAFGIDDSLCLDHPHYPGDLIDDGRSPRYPDPLPAPWPDMSKIELGSTSKRKPGRGWLSRLLLGAEKRR